MEPYQQRVVEERDALGDKIVKLSAFIYGKDTAYMKCSEHERMRLMRQLAHMQEYHDVLTERIDAIGTNYA